MISDYQIILVTLIITLILMIVILTVAYLIGKWQHNNHYSKVSKK